MNRARTGPDRAPDRAPNRARNHTAKLARPIVAAILATVTAAVGLVPALAPASVVAATPSLTIVGAATYNVLPDEGRVAVTVELTATNHLTDTATKRFFFRTGFLTVLPGTSGFRISGGRGSPKVSISAETEAYTNLKIDLGANLAAGKSTTLTLDFDLRDPGGPPDRPVRISHSLVSFSAWAVTTPETQGASVVVRMPDGYGVTVRRGPLDGPAPDGAGHELWSSGALDLPQEFVADVTADRPGDYLETSRVVPMANGSATVLLRAWPDDPAWETRIANLVARALPVLEREIGVPWPVDGPLAVHEALVRSTGGYAGVFDPAERRIDIAYAAPDGVVLHELAHAWFNGRLIADRWAAEGFAAHYAGTVARELGLDAAPPAWPAEPSTSAMPLNAWGASGSEDPAAETWAYAASLELAGRIVRRAGPDRMRAVWSAAAQGVGAYQPEPNAGASRTLEPAGGPPDWRGLLDLLEAETGRAFVDLWREWVARPADVDALADRAVTRGYYLRSVELAGDWRLPPATRQAMRAWRFDLARELLLAADAVQARRLQLEAAAAAAGAKLPGTLRDAFEGDGGLAAAAAEAAAEQAVVDAIASAQATRPIETGAGELLIIAIGLVPVKPEARLTDALEALSEGDLAGAYLAAQEAQVAWASAAQVGRARIVSVALLVIALFVFAGLVRQQRGDGRPSRSKAGTR